MGQVGNEGVLGRFVGRTRKVKGEVSLCGYSLAGRVHAFLASKKGQGTTEYAILVGVLVVIAIVAITVFRPKVEELWNAIANGINGL